MSPSPTHIGILLGLILCRSCGCCLHCCESVGARALSYQVKAAVPCYLCLIYSLLFMHLQQSIINCKKRLRPPKIRYKLRDSLVYGYNDRTLERSLLLCPVRRKIILDFVPTDWSSRHWDFSPVNSARHEYPFVEHDSDQITKSQLLSPHPCHYYSNSSPIYCMPNQLLL